NTIGPKNKRPVIYRRYPWPRPDCDLPSRATPYPKPRYRYGVHPWGGPQREFAPVPLLPQSAIPSTKLVCCGKPSVAPGLARCNGSANTTLLQMLYPPPVSNFHTDLTVDHHHSFPPIPRPYCLRLHPKVQRISWV